MMSPHSHRMVAAMMKPMPGTLWIRARVGARSAWLWMFCRRARLSVGKLAFQSNDLVDELPGRKPVRGAELGILGQKPLLGAVAFQHGGAGQIVLEGDPAQLAPGQSQLAGQPVALAAKLAQLADGFAGRKPSGSRSSRKKPGQEKRIVAVGLGQTSGAGAHPGRVPPGEGCGRGFDGVPRPMVEPDRFNSHLDVGYRDWRSNRQSGAGIWCDILFAPPPPRHCQER